MRRYWTIIAVIFTLALGLTACTTSPAGGEQTPPVVEPAATAPAAPTVSPTTPPVSPSPEGAQKGGEGGAPEDFAELEKTLAALLDVEEATGQSYPATGKVPAEYAINYLLYYANAFQANVAMEMEEIEDGAYDRYIPIYDAMAVGLLQRAFGARFDIADLPLGEDVVLVGTNYCVGYVKRPGVYEAAYLGDPNDPITADGTYGFLVKSRGAEAALLATLDVADDNTAYLTDFYLQPMEAKASEAEAVDNQTLKSVEELIAILKEYEIQLGEVAVPVPTPTPLPGEPAPEEKTEFDVVLTGVGEYKILVIKAVRELTQLSLQESKDLVDSRPSVIGKALSTDEAKSLKMALEEAGATVELR